ncbi:hypothetical protein CTAYLR_007380 [Chrysophaeum taylorii]|uniref:Sulfotransferase n=1 Tax=Chrysophaeum taylorii TaxID=2483200 RepID=A0AAD7XGA4_9STRA|nr:hypothetical protein CTAYLR_007380 [Chrysophaeum taylorii]
MESGAKARARKHLAVGCLVVVGVILGTTALVASLWWEEANESAWDVFAPGNTNATGRVQLQFIHIPKTGGKAIERWGKAHGFEWGKYDKSLTGDKRRGQFRCNKWHTPQSTKLESFCVVRQPFDRVQSEFRYRTCTKDATMWCDARVFNAWMRDVLSGPVDANDCHLLPQRAYLDYCDNALAFDEMQDHFTRLLRSRGFHGPNTTLTVVNRPVASRGHETECNPECAFAYDTLDEDVRHIFEARYAKDIEMWSVYLENRSRGLIRS